MRTPFVVLSAAMSVDGYLDDASDQRLVLSDAADLDRVDALRASCDAILVGAGTVRRDDPRLLVRSADRRRQRVAAGRPEHPTKVTLTRGGGLSPSASFFTAGDADRLVYAPAGAAAGVRVALDGLATVVDADDLLAVLADLAGRGVRRLLVEGGSDVLTQFLAGGLADELQLTVAPLFVGDPAAPRLVRPAAFPYDATRRMTLAETRRVGDLAVLRYVLR
jgi:5-amino-6-(5-phosphoribosylamino)uracil reductase